MQNNTNSIATTFFSPMLYVHNVKAAIEFYTKAFGATELRRWSNDDGSVHVAEMIVQNALFHLHEEAQHSGELSPNNLKGTTVVIGLFVDDPDGTLINTTVAGALITSPVQDYDYGYRQGNITDPFGHHWQIEKKIS